MRRMDAEVNKIHLGAFFFSDTATPEKNRRDYNKRRMRLPFGLSGDSSCCAQY